MIVLQASTQKLQAVLGGNVTTTQLSVTTVFYDHLQQRTDTTQRNAHKVTTTNNTTDVDIVAAPADSVVRNISNVTVYNKDSAAATVTVKMDDDGTETILVSQSLAASESLIYEHGTGWQIL